MEHKMSQVEYKELILHSYFKSPMEHSDPADLLSIKASKLKPKATVDFELISEYNCFLANLEYFIVPSGMKASQLKQIIEELKMPVMYPSFPCVQWNWTGAELVEWLQPMVSLPDSVEARLRQLTGWDYIRGNVDGILSMDTIKMVEQKVVQKRKKIARAIISFKNPIYSQIIESLHLDVGYSVVSEEFILKTIEDEFPLSSPKIIISKSALQVSEPPSSSKVTKKDEQQEVKIFTEYIRKIMHNGEIFNYFINYFYLESSLCGNSRLLRSRKVIDDFAILTIFIDCLDEDQQNSPSLGVVQHLKAIRSEYEMMEFLERLLFCIIGETCELGVWTLKKQFKPVGYTLNQILRSRSLKNFHKLQHDVTAAHILLRCLSGIRYNRRKLVFLISFENSHRLFQPIFEVPKYGAVHRVNTFQMLRSAVNKFFTLNCCFVFSDENVKLGKWGQGVEEHYISNVNFHPPFRTKFQP